MPYLDREACWSSKDKTLQVTDVLSGEEHRCHCRLAVVLAVEQTAAYLWVAADFGLDHLFVVLAASTGAKMPTRVLMRRCQEPLVIVSAAKLLTS